MRHLRGGPNRRRSAAKSATGEDCPHGDHAPGGERRRQCEEKGVDHVRRTGDPKAPDVDHHRHDQRASDPVMCAPPTIRRQSRQVSGNQDRLNEHETQCDNPCKSGHYVDRTAPREQLGSPLQRRSARKRRLQGRPSSGSPGPISITLFPTRSNRLKDEVPLQAGLFCAPHHGTEKDGFEFTTVIGEVTMRLAKDGNDLRHLETEHPVLVGERGPIILRFMLLPFGRVRRDLDALPGKRSPVACAAYRAVVWKPPLPIRSTVGAPLRCCGRPGSVVLALGHKSDG